MDTTDNMMSMNSVLCSYKIKGTKTKGIVVVQVPKTLHTNLFDSKTINSSHNHLFPLGTVAVILKAYY